MKFIINNKNIPTPGFEFPKPIILIDSPGTFRSQLTCSHLSRMHYQTSGFPTAERTAVVLGGDTPEKIWAVYKYYFKVAGF